MAADSATTDGPRQARDDADPSPTRASRDLTHEVQLSTRAVDSSEKASTPGSELDESIKHMAPWRLKALVVYICLISLVHGYDVSNVANIQAPIYEAFGHVETLPWVALGYSLVCVAVTPLVRRALDLGNVRATVAVFFVVFIVSCAVSGAAESMAVVVVGRALTGVGNTGVFQLNLNIVALFYKPATAAMISGIVGLSWAVGLCLGPFVGAGFAENRHTTWRWAFYIVIPFLGVLMFVAVLLLPNYNPRRGASLLQSTREMDWLGGILHMAFTILLAMCLLLSGSTWAWDSGRTIAVWVVMGITLIAYVAQQYTTFLTSPRSRAFPVEALKHRTAGLAALAATCATMAYAVSLYYLPLFFAFARSASPVQAAVHVVPFVGVFIALVVVSSAAMPRVGYYAPFYVAAGALMVVGGALMAQIRPTTSSAAVMGYEALLGFGIGSIYANSYSVANASLHDVDARLASAALFNMASTGGVALALALAGCVYQNVGFRQLRSALESFGFREQDIREALAGVESPIFESTDPMVLDTVVRKVTLIIARLFYIIVAAGAICILVGLFMRWEKLDFKRPADRGEGDGAVAEDLIKDESDGGRQQHVRT